MDKVAFLHGEAPGKVEGMVKQKVPDILEGESAPFDYGFHGVVCT
jgi:hypothetical protein